MSLARWNLKNELLNDFREKLDRATRGRLSRLRVAVVGDELLVNAACASYYVVQLALKGVVEFVDEVPQMSPARLTFSVNGRSFDVEGSGRRSRFDYVPAEASASDDDSQRRRRRGRRRRSSRLAAC